MSVQLKAIQDELRRIGLDHDGILRPEDALEEARNPDHILHSLIEWDDSIAAEQHRLDQMRAIIRGVRVVIVTETISIPVPEWVSDPDKSGRAQGYASTLKVRTDRERSERALATEINMVSSAAHRARQIALALQLQDEVDQQLLEALGVVAPVQEVRSRRQRAS